MHLASGRTVEGAQRRKKRPVMVRAGIPRFGVVGFLKLTPKKLFALTREEEKKTPKKHKNTKKGEENTHIKSALTCEKKLPSSKKIFVFCWCMLFRA